MKNVIAIIATALTLTACSGIQYEEPSQNMGFTTNGTGQLTYKSFPAGFGEGCGEQPYTRVSCYYDSTLEKRKADAGITGLNVHN